MDFGHLILFLISCFVFRIYFYYIWKNFPPFKRPEPKIVGSASPEEKEKFKEVILDTFAEGHYKRLSQKEREIIIKHEIEKSPIDMESIRLSNKISNNFLKELNIEAFDIPWQNIHFLPADQFIKLNSERREAATFINSQSIALSVDKDENFIKRCQSIFHEIIHLKGFMIYELTEGAEIKRRVGLAIGAPAKERDERYASFVGLNEAVVFEIEKRYLQQIINQHFLLKDKLGQEFVYQHSEEAQDIKNQASKKENIPIDELYWLKEEVNKVKISSYSYYSHRRVLYKLVDEIYADNQDKFQSKDEVMKEFLKAHFVNDLTKIYELIKNSFGKDAWQMLGMMGNDTNSANQVLNYLKKQRRLHKKSK